MSKGTEWFHRETPEQRAEQRRLMALPFRMVILEAFEVKWEDRVLNVAVTGRIETGIVRDGDAIMISDDVTSLQTQVERLEMMGRGEERPIERWAGDNVGIILPRNITKAQVKSGMIVTKRDEQ